MVEVRILFKKIFFLCVFTAIFANYMRCVWLCVIVKLYSMFMGKLLRFSSLLGMLVFIFMGNVFSQEEKKYVLVSDIDFRVPNAELLPYPLESINPSGYEGGVIKPQVTIGDTFQFFRSGASGLDSSLFLSTPSYAIVQNPIALDSFRMIDNNEMNGIVFSSGSEGFKGAGPRNFIF